MKNNSICIDNHLLIWGIQQRARPEQIFMIDRTRIFLEHLEKQATRIIVPSIVLGEFFVGIPETDRLEMRKLIARSCMIVSYDIAAAHYFARIWDSKKDVLDAMVKARDCTRQGLKADCMIVATAMSNKADYICSEDQNLCKLAQGHIPTQSVPVLPKQAAMF